MVGPPTYPAPRQQIFNFHCGSEAAYKKRIEAINEL